MIFHGKVRNRQIEIPAGVSVPEGAEVEVRIISTPTPVPAPAAKPPPAASAPGQKRHILVVDDMEPLRELAEFVLIAAGYSVSVAENTDEALRILAENPAVTLVLTDLELPGRMSGLDMARRVRTERPDLVVLLTSGHAIELSPEGELHGFPFIAKTSWSDGLTGKVQSCLAGK